MVDEAFSQVLIDGGFRMTSDGMLVGWENRNFLETIRDLFN
jgi:hypothetical protein